LQERELQLEHKARRILAEKEQEIEEVLKSRQANLEGEKDDRLKLEREIQKRLDFAKGLKVGVDEKKGRSGKESIDQASIDAITTKIAEEYRKERKTRKKRKGGIGNEAISSATIIGEKGNAVLIKAKKVEQDQELQELEENNQRFNSMKISLDIKRKEHLAQQSMYIFP
jgi:hypothetical protein